MATHEPTKFLCGQLGLQPANVSTRCSSPSQGKSGGWLKHLVETSASCSLVPRPLPVFNVPHKNREWPGYKAKQVVNQALSWIFIAATATESNVTSCLLNVVCSTFCDTFHGIIISSPMGKHYTRWHNGWVWPTKPGKRRIFFGLVKRNPFSMATIDWAFSHDKLILELIEITLHAFRNNKDSCGHFNAQLECN